MIISDETIKTLKQYHNSTKNVDMQILSDIIDLMRVDISGLVSAIEENNENNETNTQLLSALERSCDELEDNYEKIDYIDINKRLNQ